MKNNFEGGRVMGRITDRKAMLHALDDAIQWQDGFREANLGHDDEQVELCDKMLAAYRRVYSRMEGTRATFREINEMIELKDTETISVAEIRRRIDGGEIPITAKESANG
jgi:hypothetical protein